jgi:hypothetical protein
VSGCKTSPLSLGGYEQAEERKWVHFFCRLSQSMRTRERDDGGGVGNETFGALGIFSSAKNEKQKQ